MPIIKPQPGPQEKFLKSPADIVIYGGGAGGGKSWALLLEALRWIRNPDFNAVLFRRTYPMIRNAGGLWDASCRLLPLVGGKPRESDLSWQLRSGAALSFRHLKLASDRFSWQGSEISYIAFDELTHFTDEQFWYLLGRNRTTCGIRPYMRGTCNPDSESWVRGLVDWWIGEDGFPIAARSGVVRHFERRDGELVWFNEPTEDSKSFTFIPASVFDNPALLAADPDYLRNLKSQSLVERSRLLDGNWNIKASAGKVFKQDWFEPISLAELQRMGSLRQVRFWDFAATADRRGSDPDWTVGVKLLTVPGGRLVVADVRRIRGTPGEVDQLFQQTAHADGPHCLVRWFQDPGQAGVYQTNQLRASLPGFDADGVTCQLSKANRAQPASRAAEFGEIDIVSDPSWNQGFLNELSQFPDGSHDDQVDALAGAYNYLSGIYDRRFSQSRMSQS